MRGIAWRRYGAARTWHALVVTAGVGVVVVTLACSAMPALSADGENGSEPPTAPAAPSCPSSNPPNRLTLVAGTPQSATLGSAFATSLQVALTNSNGCAVTSPVAGAPVMFSAPTVGASGLFAASGSSSVTVGSDASGMASAPAFTANDTPGGYTVTATSAYGSVTFSLTNAEGSGSSACATLSNAALAGKPAKLAVGVGASQSTRMGTHFGLRLVVTATDAEREPVGGVLIAFTAPVRGPSGSFGGHSHPRRVEVRTDACGVARAPVFTANRRAGGYIVVASVERVRAAFALVNRGPRR
ncbi:MAG: Ig-like domain-containing protein [Solirubrobacteraceae bacterium]